MVIILILLASLMAGSVGPVNKSAGTNGHGAINEHALIYGRAIDQMPPLPPIADFPGNTRPSFTTIILDLPKQGIGAFQGMPSVYNASMPGGPGFFFDRNEIMGRMTVHAAGVDSPQTFQVKFIKSPGNLSGQKNMHDLYRASMAFKYELDSQGKPVRIAISPINDTMGNESDFILNSELILGDQFTQNASAGTGVSDYNYNISEGESSWHEALVTDTATTLNVDLKWKNPDDKLRLMIYTPDGHILGPYNDSSDGSTDGRINLNITNTNGIAKGAWYLKVTGTDVIGKDEYYIRTS